MVWWMSQKMMRFFSCRNDVEEVRMDDNCKGRPKPDDQVASEDKRSIGSVGNGFGSD